MKPGIVHLGIGNLHRAHQAICTDHCLAAGQLDWGHHCSLLRRFGRAGRACSPRWFVHSCQSSR
ncbi:hypothetical protein [Mesorhizobium sp. M0833]|uniref:hypothetical protein n=1 Tax=Mesorhizobium sp. M0833 TaxID=2957009 RepID=UPI003334D4BD